LQARNARVTINAVHPGIVKTGIIRAHKGLLTGRLKFHQLIIRTHFHLIHFIKCWNY